MSELNRLKVVDFTAGRLSSDDINTDIPFSDNFNKTRTIQQANAVIGAYVNRNYVDMQNKADIDDVPTKLSELDNDVGYITTGDIPTKTSELSNDGADGVNPFITANDIPSDISSFNNDVGYITNTVNDLTNYTDNTTLSGLLNAKASVNVGVYSLTETVVGTFLGKPLYRKVFDYISTVPSGWSGVAFSTLGISNIDYLRVVSALGRNGGSYEEMTSHQNRVVINTTGEALSLYLTDSSLQEIIFILEYTKTTD